MNMLSGLVYLSVLLLSFVHCSHSTDVSEKCDSDIVIEQKLRKVIFTAAVGNATKLSHLEETDYCKYHIFTGALINLLYQLPISKSINEFIHDGITEVIGTCKASLASDDIELDMLRACLDKIESRLTSDAVINEHYVDTKTAIETKMATESNHTCKRDFVIIPTPASDKNLRFVLHQRFLDLTTNHVNATCDRQSYDYSVLALAVIKIAKRPDFRPTVNQMYEDSIHETSLKMTKEFEYFARSSDCPIISSDPNMVTLMTTLEQKIKGDEKLNVEIELAKKEVTPP